MLTRGVVLACLALATAGPQTFRTATEGVRVDVLVTDGRAPAAGLASDDFEVRDNGVLQHVTSLARGDVPLSVLFALDTSASVAGEKLEHLRAAMTRALSALGPEDRAALLTFAQQIAMPSEFTDRGAGLTDLLGAFSGSGATSLNDAAFTAMLVQDSRPGRQLVLILTDGRDTSSWLPADAVIAAARRSNTVIYGVNVASGTPASADPWVDVAARLPLEPGSRFSHEPPLLVRLTDETGRRVFEATADAAGDRLADALHEFKSRYLLTYTPEGVDKSGWHTLEVRVKRPDVKVTARRGYQK